MDAIDISHARKEKKESPKPEKSEEGFLQGGFSLFKSGLKNKKKEEFYTELGELLASGIDLKNALELITAEQAKEEDKEVFGAIKEKVVNGSSLSEAMKAIDKFSSYEYHSVEIGQETGNLAMILSQLAIYYRKRIDQQRQLSEVMSYPIFIITLSIGLIAVMMNMMMPMMTSFYQNNGKELPELTQTLIGLSNFLTDYFYLFLIGAGILFLLNKRESEKEWYRKLTGTLVLQIPVLGELMRKIYLGRFCSSMTFLLKSKVTLPHALELSRKMIGFYPIEISLIEIEKDIVKGIPLYKSVSKFPIFYPKMITLIRMGEEINKLDSFFERLGKQYSEEVEHQTVKLKAWMNRVITLILAGIVGTILLATYLPMLDMSTGF